MGKGQSLDASVNWSVYSKSVELGFVDPYFLDKPILFGGNLFRRDYRSFNFIGSDRNTTYSQVSTGGALRMGFPITEYWSFGGRYTLQQRQDLARQDDLLHRSRRHRAASAELRSAQGGPLSVRRTRQPADLAPRLLDGLRRHRRHPPDARPASDLSEDFAGLGGDVRYLRSRVDATKYHSVGGGWVVSVHGEGGYIAPLQKSPGPGPRRGPPDRPLLRPGPARLRHPRHRPADPARSLQCRRHARPRRKTDHRPTRSAAAPITWAGSSSSSRQLGLKSLGLRPSAFVDVGSLWNIKQPILIDVRNICTPIATRDRPRSVHEPRRRLQRRFDRRRARRDAIRRHSGLQGILPWQFAQAAPVDRHRRQLGFAVRPAAHRSCQGPAQAKGRRHQIVQLQRRNPILMKKLLISASLAASALLPAAAQAQAIPAAVVAVVDLDKVTQRLQRLQDRAGRPAAARSQRCRRRATGARRRRCRPNSKSIQAAVDALNGKEPDAALQARITGVPDQAAAGRAGARSASRQQLQRNQQYVQQADRRQARPDLHAGDAAPRRQHHGRDRRNARQRRQSLDVTNDVLAALNTRAAERPDDRSRARPQHAAAGPLSANERQPAAPPSARLISSG